MKKITHTIILILVILSFILMGCEQKNNKDPNGNDLPKNIVIIDGKEEYPSIQEAIDASIKGDILYVYEGIYNETIIINKTISLIGKGKNKPILIYNKNESGNIITIEENNCIVDGFNMSSLIKHQDISGVLVGIKISSSNNKIFNNTISNTYRGIQISSNQVENNISYNTLSNNTEGIEGIYTSYNDIFSNEFYNNSVHGLYLGLDSNQNIISYNTFVGNGEAVKLKGVSGNIATQNILKNNRHNIVECCGAQGKNTIKANTIITE